MGDTADFVLVYIDEAHGADEWPISSSRFNGNRGAVNVRQTRTLQERRAAAAELRDGICEPPCPRKREEAVTRAARGARARDGPAGAARDATSADVC